MRHALSKLGTSHGIDKIGDIALVQPAEQQHGIELEILGQRIGNHLVELFNRLVDLRHAMLNDRNTKLEELLGHSAHEIAEACGSIAIERRGHATLAASRASSQVRCNALARCNRAKREVVDERFIELWAVDRSLVVVIERFKHKAHDALLLLRAFCMLLL